MKKIIVTIMSSMFFITPAFAYASDEKPIVNDDFKLVQATMLHKLSKKIEKAKNSKEMSAFLTKKKICAEKAVNVTELEICKAQKP